MEKSTYDISLIEQARKGNAEAFSELYKEVYRELYRFALYTLRNTHDAEDVVSDTVLDAWKQIASLREAKAFKGWIFQILSNKCKRKLKEYVNKMVAIPDDLSKEFGNVGEHVDVRRAFSTLTGEERMILSLNLFAGYTSKEIGKILHLSANTVRSKQSRALKKMEGILEVHYG